MRHPVYADYATIIKRLCLVLLLCSGCAEVPIQQNSAWSSNLPHRDYFETQYQNDPINAELQPLEEYLRWVNRFYLGWELYPTGWNHIIHNIVPKISEPSVASGLQEKLQALGKTIASEWSKDNSTRRITTKHVAIWGQALQQSLQYGQTALILNQIANEVDGLLNHNLSADLISANRFYGEEDPFKELQ